MLRLHLQHEENFMLYYLGVYTGPDATMSHNLSLEYNSKQNSHPPALSSQSEQAWR